MVGTGIVVVCMLASTIGIIWYFNRDHEEHVRRLINKDDWEALFPRRHKGYTYDNFITAVKKMSEKGCEQFLRMRTAYPFEHKRELCAFLANIHHETSGLEFREEKNPPDKYRNLGSRDKEYRMKDGASYHGRGPLQLSHAYNYGDFSKVWYGEAQTLLDSPDRLRDDPILGMSAAIWFWMTQPALESPLNAHKCMYKGISELKPWGFGRTIMVINGDFEENASGSGSSAKCLKVKNRIKIYRQCAARLKIENIIGVDDEQLNTLGFHKNP